EIFGYRMHGCRRALCIMGATFTCGFLLLVLYWKPEWHVWINCVPSTIEEADVVLLRTTDVFKRYTRKVVRWVDLSTATDKPEHPLIADEASLLNRAIMEPELKVREFQLQKSSGEKRERERERVSHYKFQNVKLGPGAPRGLDCHETWRAWVTPKEPNIKQLIFGLNVIDTEVTPIWKLLFKEVLNPFYVFQVFSVCLWFAEEYVEYSIAILIMSAISLTLSMYDVRQQSVKLQELVESHNHTLVNVWRKNGGFKEVASAQLVPGDVFQIKESNMCLPCDALLINGGCIVNESMLTGESIPVTKTPLPHLDRSNPWKTQSSGDHKRHVLFCGTQVIQTKAAGKEPVKAVVLQTGFNTAKGELVRSILYPKPMDFKLFQDAFRFLMCLIVIGMIGMIYAVCVFSLSGESAGEAVMKALDVITIAVPPALPAAMTVGIIYAQGRLKKRGVFCISPQRINICGQLNLICFDKTGTLTEDGLDLWGLIPAEENCFQNIHRFNNDNNLPWGPLLAAMASCHSLIILDEKVQGDPLDLKMFEATEWALEDFNTEKQTTAVETETQVTVIKPGSKANWTPVLGIAILHQFPFSSTMQRMSVVTQEIGKDELVVYMKGAPEMVASLCSSATVPVNFSSELHGYTKQGFRVIAFAYKPLKLRGLLKTQNEGREVESDLTFLGLLILENRLKPETVPVLEELRNARIRTIMITGDNLETAVTVAKNAGMILGTSKVILVEAQDPVGSTPASITWKHRNEKTPNGLLSTREIYINVGTSELQSSDYHFAMTGNSFKVIVQHFGNLISKLLINGTVFARMSPGQKASLIEEFQKLDYYVGMCGDGANDCGALKTAHAGISLSEQEASVASPFTSKIPNIECVPLLIKEGRAALVTSFCVFKYMALYSMIQYIGVLLLYWQLNNFGDYQFFFQDLIITTVISVTINLNHAYPKLVPYRPLVRLISPPLLLSVAFNIVLSLAMQTFGFLAVQQQQWYSQDIHSACMAVPQNLNGSLISGNVSVDVNVTGNATEDSEEEDMSEYSSYENTTVWLLSLMNCIIAAFVFSKGKLFRKPIYTNYIFVLVLMAQLGVCLFFLFADIKNLYEGMDLVCTPTIWRVYILIMLLINLAISLIVEETIIENRRLWNFMKKCFKIQPTSSYKKLRGIVLRDSSWPPCHGTDYALQEYMTVGESNEAYCNAVYEHDEDLEDVKNKSATTVQNITIHWTTI
uniref:Cation-transporting ATPase n=1 Tax=Latimeria chalumnae TaxID=7897 RepID=H2ZW02_LATCH